LGQGGAGGEPAGYGVVGGWQVETCDIILQQLSKWIGLLVEQPGIASVEFQIHAEEEFDGRQAEPGNEEGQAAQEEQEAGLAEEGERRQAGQVESLVHEWDDDPNIDDLITERRPANYCRVCGAELW